MATAAALDQEMAVAYSAVVLAVFLAGRGVVVLAYRRSSCCVLALLVELADQRAQIGDVITILAAVVAGLQHGACIYGCSSRCIWPVAAAGTFRLNNPRHCAAKSKRAVSKCRSADADPIAVYSTSGISKSFLVKNSTRPVATAAGFLPGKSWLAHGIDTVSISGIHCCSRSATSKNTGNVSLPRIDSTGIRISFRPSVVIFQCSMAPSST